MSEVAPLDPERLITVLAKHRVRYILIGALAARLQGFPRLTADAGITPAADSKNLDRLAAALKDLGAKIFTESVPEGLPFDCSRQMLGRAPIWNLVTSAGRLDLAFAPAGTEGYHDLAANALRVEAFGVKLQVAALADIIRSKEAAGRPKDRQDVLLLRELQRRVEDKRE